MLYAILSDCRFQTVKSLFSSSEYPLRSHLLIVTQLIVLINKAEPEIGSTYINSKHIRTFNHFSILTYTFLPSAHRTARISSLTFRIRTHLRAFRPRLISKFPLAKPARLAEVF